MKYSSVTISLLILTVLTASLIISGVQRRPGIGIIISLIAIPMVIRIRGESFSQIGLSLSQNWGSVIVQGFGYGLLITLLSISLIEPFSEAITQTTHDLSSIVKLRSNPLALAQVLLMVWVFVAAIEELIFRGFFISELSRIIGSGPTASIVTVIVTSVVFGLCHAYQNTCGIITTGIIGALLSIVYILSGRNLWVAIFTHGFIDTFGIFSIYYGFDSYIRQLLWKA